MIDAHAIVARGAELAEDVHVGPFSVIGPHVKIGARTTIGAHVIIAGHTQIGPDNRIFQFCSIGEEPQDKKYRGEPTRLQIGARNVFREYCSVHRGTAHEEGVTRIGDDNWLLAYTHIAHDCVLGNNIVLSNCVQIAGHVLLGDWVNMAGFSGAHQFCKIGAHAFIANNTAVTRDVPPFIMATGQPAVPHSINSEGLKRRGFSAEQIRNLRNAYRVLYRSELPLATAVEQLAALAASQPELQPFVDFIAADSDRSLIR